MLAGLGSDDEKLLTTLRESMGEMQHHDAITGTEKQHVADDYGQTLDQAFTNYEQVIDNALRYVQQQPEQN